MSDRRIVQCFGTKRKRGQPDKPCRRRYAWTSVGGKDSHFGGRGVQACPHCGAIPVFNHPYNIYLGGDISYEEAVKRMPSFVEDLEKEST